MAALAFRVDALPAIGHGHMMRCAALASAASAQGLACRLLTADPNAFSLGEWQDSGCRIETLPPEITPGSSVDTEATARFAEDALLVLDGYHFGKDFWSHLPTQPMLWLDDLAEEDHPVAAVLNHNPGANQRFGDRYSQAGRRLLGLEYALIRPSVGRQTYQGGNGLLLNFGGSDLDNLGLAALKALIDTIEAPITLVCTAGPAGLAEASVLASDRIRVLPPTDLAPLIAKADVFFCAGGVTALEAARIGAPLIVLPIADNQRPGASALAATGAAQLVTSMAEGAGAVRDLLHNRPASHTSGIIDGKGAVRILAALADLF